LVVEWRPGLLQRDLRAWLARDADGQPTVLTLADVVALLEPKLVHVKVERLVLVEDVDRGDIEPGNHVVSSPLCTSLRMSLTLRSERRSRFSKTARLQRLTCATLGRIAASCTQWGATIGP